MKILREYINFVLTKKWIQHFTSSTRASVLFMLKKNDKLKLCVDYRELNKMTKKNRHSLFLITQILNQLNKSKYFSKIDFKNVYHCIRIRRDDEWKTTFCTRYKHFEYLMMFFDLVNVSTIFQAYVNKTMTSIVNIFCMIYLNDILIFFNNREKHVKHVREVLKRLWKFELYVNSLKCEFLSRKLNISSSLWMSMT